MYLLGVATDLTGQDFRDLGFKAKNKKNVCNVFKKQSVDSNVDEVPTIPRLVD